MLHAQRAAMLGQQRGKAPGVEVVGVVHRPQVVGIVRALGRVRGVGHALLHRHRLGEGHAGAGIAVQPVGQQLEAAGALAGVAEGMEVLFRAGLAGCAHPVAETHALLEGGAALAMKRASSMPIADSVPRIEGKVPSPTPTMPISGDSTRVTCTPDASRAASCFARKQAVSQPAVPPPTIKTRVMGDGGVHGSLLLIGVAFLLKRV
jgi:hypothetical protein